VVSSPTREGGVEALIEPPHPNNDEISDKDDEILGGDKEPNSPVEEEPVDTRLQMPMPLTPSTDSSVESHKYSVDDLNEGRISDDERAQGTCRRGSVGVNDPTPGTKGRGDQST
ncbi:unnamed protein product, partial [Discosporangium mesarthrocarpum]